MLEFFKQPLKVIQIAFKASFFKPLSGYRF